MAGTSYTGPWSLRNTIIKQVLNNQNIVQQFADRRDAIRLLPWVNRSTLSAVSPDTIAALRNTQPGQSVNINLYNRRANGSGTQRVRSGTGSPTVTAITPSLQDLVQEGVEMSFVGKSSSYIGDGAQSADALRRAYEEEMTRNFLDRVLAIYDRVEAQFASYIDSNVWALSTTADAGDQYETIVANTKQIPLVDVQNEAWIQKIQTESMQNNFSQFGRIALLASTGANTFVKDYEALGAANNRNVGQFLGDIDFVMSNKFTASKPSGTSSVMYSTFAGAVACYNRIFDWSANPQAVNGVVTTGEDTWEVITVGAGTAIYPELPTMRLEVKYKRGYADNFATYGVDEARIDIAENVSLTTQWGLFNALASQANEEPILRYATLTS